MASFVQPGSWIRRTGFWWRQWGSHVAAVCHLVSGSGGSRGAPGGGGWREARGGCTESRGDGGGTGYPGLRVRGAWVMDAGQGRGPRVSVGASKAGPQSLPASSDLPHEVTLEGTFLSLVLMGWIWFLSCPL